MTVVVNCLGLQYLCYLACYYDEKSPDYIPKEKSITIESISCIDSIKNENMNFNFLGLTVLSNSNEQSVKAFIGQFKEISKYSSYYSIKGSLYPQTALNHKFLPDLNESYSWSYPRKYNLFSKFTANFNNLFDATKTKIRKFYTNDKKNIKGFL